MLSVCSVWITDKSPSSLSPSAPILSITFCVSFLVSICSLFLSMLLLYFVFSIIPHVWYALMKMSLFLFIFISFKVGSLRFLNLPFQLLRLLASPPLSPLYFSVLWSLRLSFQHHHTIIVVPFWDNLLWWRYNVAQAALITLNVLKQKSVWTNSMNWLLLSFTVPLIQALSNFVNQNTQTWMHQSKLFYF